MPLWHADREAGSVAVTLKGLETRAGRFSTGADRKQNCSLFAYCPTPVPNRITGDCCSASYSTRTAAHASGARLDADAAAGSTVEFLEEKLTSYSLSEKHDNDFYEKSCSNGHRHDYARRHRVRQRLVSIVCRQERHLEYSGVRYVHGKPSAITVPKAMSNAAASNVAIRFKSRGPNLTVSTACSSGANAIGQAYYLIRYGIVERMITGGVDAPITPAVMYHWESLRVLSTQNEHPARACKPFSANRDGFVLAEGTGIVILETLDRALERGAHIYGAVVGYASTADASHITLPDTEGESQAITGARKDAHLVPADIDYINAHGTATKFNDSSETRAIKQVFGERAYEIPVSSIKAMLGHSMGASGAVEFIATILAVERNLMPPTINYEEPDPECDLDYVTEGARPIAERATLRTAMSNSFGFGGNNAVLAARQYSE